MLESSQRLRLAQNGLLLLSVALLSSQPYLVQNEYRPVEYFWGDFDYKICFHGLSLTLIQDAMRATCAEALNRLASLVEEGLEEGLFPSFPHCAGS